MSVVHDTFVLEHDYDASPERVFAAWSDPKAKAQWFGAPDELGQSDHELDFRIGGKERISGGPPNGPVYSYEATIEDIVPNERLIYTYHMHLNGEQISVSIATIEFHGSGEGTRLVVTEQGTYLDGRDDPRSREAGTIELLGALNRFLQG